MSRSSADKKAAIITAVQWLASEHGMYDVTIGRVAESAGVPKSVVLYHFPSRERLVDAALAAWLRPLSRRLELALDPQVTNPRDQLSGWLREHFEADLAGWRLLLQAELAGPDAPVTRRARAFAVHAEKDLARLLRRGHREMAWRAPRPAATSTALRSLVTGLLAGCCRGAQTPDKAYALARATALDWLL